MNQIRVALEERELWPTRSHPNDAGLDLKSKALVTIKSGETAKVDTGVRIEIPVGYVGMLFPRSGKPFKLSNTIGVIDSDYRGEIIAKVENTSGSVLIIPKHDRFVQLVIIPCITPTVIPVNKLTETKRGVKGLGHSGK